MIIQHTYYVTVMWKKATVFWNEELCIFLELIKYELREMINFKTLKAAAKRVKKVQNTPAFAF